MHSSGHAARRRFARLVVVAGMAIVVAAALAGPAFAGINSEIIPLSGGVNEGGACTTVSGSGIHQTWEFRVNDIFGDTSAAKLFADFSDGTNVDGVAPTTPDDAANEATWLVTTAAGATLKSASADVTNSNPDGATLIVVSCTLGGVETTTTAAPTTTVAPTTTTLATVAPAAVTTTTVAAAAQLPRTGSTSTPVLTLGLLTLVAGAGLMIWSRRTAKAS